MKKFLLTLIVAVVVSVSAMAEVLTFTGEAIALRPTGGEWTNWIPMKVKVTMNTNTDILKFYVNNEVYALEVYDYVDWHEDNYGNVVANFYTTDQKTGEDTEVGMSFVQGRLHIYLDASEGTVGIDMGDASAAMKNATSGKKKGSSKTSKKTSKRRR